MLGYTYLLALGSILSLFKPRAQVSPPKIDLGSLETSIHSAPCVHSISRNSLIYIGRHIESGNQPNIHKLIGSSIHIELTNHLISSMIFKLHFMYLWFNCNYQISLSRFIDVLSFLSCRIGLKVFIPWRTSPPHVCLLFFYSDKGD